MAWFMQDGAPSHTASDATTYLKELFNSRLFALGTDHEWAPHSPNLNPLDFWLGELQSKPCLLTSSKV